MAERTYEQRCAQARTAYLSAALRFTHALTRFDNSGMAMDPGPGPEPLPWTPEQWSRIRALSTAAREVFDRRRDWEQMLRDRPYRP